MNHVELAIGDPIIMMEKAAEHHPTQTTILYIYVEDTCAAYNRALEKGAESVIRLAYKSINLYLLPCSSH